MSEQLPIEWSMNVTYGEWSLPSGLSLHGTMTQTVRQEVVPTHTRIWLDDTLVIDQAALPNEPSVFPGVSTYALYLIMPTTSPPNFSVTGHRIRVEAGWRIVATAVEGTSMCSARFLMNTEIVADIAIVGAGVTGVAVVVYARKRRRRK